jgi:uncharacterized RDD family membrane protein YckC
VSSWIDSWLAGGKLAAPAPEQSAEEPERFRGERMGLPERGVGSVAGLGRRFGALVIDCVIAAVLTSLFVRAPLTDTAAMQSQNYWSLAVWFVITVIGVSLFGVTPGMAALGIRVVRLDGKNLVGPVRAAVRAVLTAVVIPAVVWNAERRALHDRATGTMVLNSR